MHAKRSRGCYAQGTGSSTSAGNALLCPRTRKMMPAAVESTKVVKLRASALATANTSLTQAAHLVSLLENRHLVSTSVGSFSLPSSTWMKHVQVKSGTLRDLVRDERRCAYGLCSTTSRPVIRRASSEDDQQDEMHNTSQDHKLDVSPHEQTPMNVAQARSF